MGFVVGQAVWPVEQLCVHFPPLHTWPAEHFVPHAPQLLGSVWSFVQKAVEPVPQAFGVAVGQAQVLLVQAWPAGQTTPQPPQLLGSLDVVAQ